MRLLALLFQKSEGRRTKLNKKIRRKNEPQEEGLCLVGDAGNKCAKRVPIRANGCHGATRHSRGVRGRGICVGGRLCLGGRGGP